MENEQQKWRTVLTSGLAYGSGLVAGALVSTFLFNNMSLDRITAGQKILSGLVLAFVVAGIGGAVSGLIGGYSLPMVHRPRGRWGYAWRSAISFGLFFGFLFYPILFSISLLSFYVETAGTLRAYAVIYTTFGALFGALNGLLMGLLTVGRRRTWPVVVGSTVGFALGGLFLGIMTSQYINSIKGNTLQSGRIWWVLLALFLFAGCGGALLGYVYHRLADEPQDARSRTEHGLSRWRYVVISVLILALVVVFRPIINGLGAMITPHDAGLATVIESNTIGTHWSTPLDVAQELGATAVTSQVDIAADGESLVTLTWNQLNDTSQDVYVMRGLWDAQSRTTSWEPPLNASQNALATAVPQIALDSNGRTHLVWQEDIGRSSNIRYTACSTTDCDPPLTLSAELGCTGNGRNSAPTLAINQEDQLLVVWQNSADTLTYASWSANASPPTTPNGCVPSYDTGPAVQPHLAGGNGRFALTYHTGGTQAGEIYVQAYKNDAWANPVAIIGNGQSPATYIDQEDIVHVAWCETDKIVHQAGQTGPQIASDLACHSRPTMAQDNEGALHIVWYATAVDNNFERRNEQAIIYEAVQHDGTWTPPVIITQPVGLVQPQLSVNDNGTLFVAWAGKQLGTTNLHYATQMQYACDETQLTEIESRVLAVTSAEKYRPPGDTVPYCHNQYDTLIFTPNANPAYSNNEPTINGAFDNIADLVRATNYEVSFSTMWYDADAAGNNDSPGAVLATAVADLYTQVKTNPELYPRGITVRILLGHPPEYISGDLSGQLWNVINDLRDAGLPEMVNPELGWRVEVADFAGSLPHSHAKTLIVDGATAVAAGFNYSYAHFDADHPSGGGEDRNDLGLQVTGPIAQDTQRIFDDMWEGANRRHCRNFYPLIAEAWQTTCTDFPATSDHVPEVQKYYLPESIGAPAFSMYRTEAHDAADQQVAAALGAAQESIDAFHVNFTMDMICDLNFFFDVCGFEGALPYMNSIMNAVESNGVKARILIKEQPIDGVESTINVKILYQELAERGLLDQVEIRLFNGAMHTKSALVDQQFLIVGSQNFHYSAYGEGTGLVEYNLGTSDPQAIEDYQRLFEYHWARAKPLAIP